ncbi:MAG: tRNA pseudouridine(38-40) synthase TruA [Anaerolineales bacterium]|nr:tRNA pseudouridine(38-40) synthase TruA [Chloroflexota bacterium]MBL6982552.1 tRNA pseudouridine(38-40) synthase TruA [Anaerolineales bacterium]
MARYQVILAYDGTEFHGSQRQLEVRTVQGVVEDALRKLSWAGETIIMAGRTDTGVHASGQVLAFDLNWSHTEDDLRNALNALLLDDVSARSVAKCDAEFHPRFDALSRTYRYKVFIDPVPNPLEERYSWRIWPSPDVGNMQDVANLFLGVHDFAAFGSPMKQGGSTVREINAVGWDRGSDANTLEFVVTANAFLYHMVRRLVHVHVKVGQGVLSVEQIRQYLDAPEGPPVQGLAPAQGLVLEEVKYQQE